MKLAERTVVVTGGAGGIGRALALACAAEGARVAVTDIAAEPLTRVGEELGDGHLAVAADVTDERALGSLLSDVESELGRVDVFFANAGVAIGEDPLDTPDEVWDLAFSVNIRAHILAARRLLPGWLERGEGYFVTTASAAGLLTQIGSAPYAVTKHAAVAFAEWLSITHGEQGIVVSCLAPQAFTSNLLNTSRREVGAGSMPETGTGGGSAQAAVDGVLTSEQVAAAVLAAVGTEQFLILPHPEVATYERRRAGDRERWLGGMRRMQARLSGL